LCDFCGSCSFVGGHDCASRLSRASQEALLKQYVRRLQTEKSQSNARMQSTENIRDLTWSFGRQEAHSIAPFEQWRKIAASKRHDS
jgi:hypothetical protein